MTLSEACAVLGVTSVSDLDAVRAAWLQAARNLHPDVGGDAAAFDRARQAYELLVANDGKDLPKEPEPRYWEADEEVEDVWVVEDEFTQVRSEPSMSETPPGPVTPPRPETPSRQSESKKDRFEQWVADRFFGGVEAAQMLLHVTWRVLFPLTLVLTLMLTGRALNRLVEGPYFLPPWQQGRFPWWGGDLYLPLMDLFGVPGVALAALVLLWGWLIKVLFMAGSFRISKSKRYRILRVLSYIGLFLLLAVSVGTLQNNRSIPNNTTAILSIAILVAVFKVRRRVGESFKRKIREAASEEARAVSEPRVNVSERVPVLLRLSLVGAGTVAALPHIIRATNSGPALVGTAAVMWVVLWLVKDPIREKVRGR